MPAYIAEKWDSRPSQVDAKGLAIGTELKYVIAGTTDDAEVHALVVSELPAMYMVAGKTTFYQNYAIEPKGHDVWEATARYAAYEPLEVTWSGDTTGGTQHITQSINTILSQLALFQSGEVPDFQNAIGVNGETVQGVDIYAKQLAFQANLTVPRHLFTPTYQATLYNLTATVNQAPFRGLAKGECLFLGASWVDKSSAPYVDLTCKFMGSPNRTYESLEIGDFEEFEKEGWHYLWFLYKDQVDSTAKSIVKRAYALFVEQVYEYSDFNQLGLGL